MILNLLLASCDGDSSSPNSSSRNPSSGPPPRESPCPDNFVLIPALEGYTTDDFCVMKYEAKNDGSGNAISQASGTPYVQINQADSIAKCVAMGDGYDLITNNEWQSIARNIELVPSNWRYGTVGWDGTEDGRSNGLNRGQSNNNPNMLLEASTNDDDACKGTQQTAQSCSSSTWHHQRRTHTLRNGEVIWDLAGNAGEWIKNRAPSIYNASDYMLVVINDDERFAQEFTLNGEQKKIREHFGPSSNYTDLATSNPWGGFGGASLQDQDSLGLRGIHRGGSNGTAFYSGVFAVNLSIQGGVEYPRIGFRCVYHL